MKNKNKTNQEKENRVNQQQNKECGKKKIYKLKYVQYIGIFLLLFFFYFNLLWCVNTNGFFFYRYFNFILLKCRYLKKIKIEHPYLFRN